MTKSRHLKRWKILPLKRWTDTPLKQWTILPLKQWIIFPLKQWIIPPFIKGGQGGFLFIFALSIALMTVYVDSAFSIQRFPPPQFRSGHELPITTVPGPRANLYEYLDVIVLVLVLSYASYLALRRRSRRGILYLGIFSLLYFGFWRKGCVCPIGAIQNVALAIFDRSYTIPITVVAFFILPLIYTLVFGRSFCASVCPLGAIQDVVLLHPIKVPSWLEHALRMAAYVYLSLAVLLAATGSAFIICEYDPFVAFFRRNGSFKILILGTALLLMGIFVGRPYCRFLCPYSVLLGFMSRFSRWHVAITPGECIQCRLCEDSCPFGAIQKPNQDQKARSRTEGKRRLAVLIALLPALIISGGILGFFISEPISNVNSTVSLAQRVWLENTGRLKDTIEASDAFYRTGRPAAELFREAFNIDKKFTIGASALGAFIGLAFGMKMIQLSVKRSRLNYEANRTTCLSCGRCFAYCPIV